MIDRHRVLFPAGLYAALVFAQVGCSGSGAAPASSQPSQVTSSSAGKTAFPPVSAAPSSSAPVSSGGFEILEGKPVRDTVPGGLTPLTEAEVEEAEEKCKPLADAIKKSMGKSKGVPSPTVVLEALDSPPAVSGVDVPRCAELIRRDLLVFVAKTKEIEAQVTLKRIAMGLAAALENEPDKLCPSAPPVPPDLKVLEKAPYKGSASDWSHPGWKCVGYEPPDITQYFQYELRTDQPTNRYLIIARGYVVRGQEPKELFIQGTVENGKLSSGTVMRR